MKLTEEQQNAVINGVIKDWVVTVDQRLQDEIRKGGQYIPQDTADNMFFEVLKATAGGTAKVLLSFQDSGRHVDMRTLEYEKAPITKDINFILNWVKKKGISSFKYVPGYQDGKGANLPEDKRLMRIASAIIQSKRGTTKKNKRRSKWFNKAFYQEVGRLVSKLSKEQVEYLAAANKTSLEKAFKQK